MFNCGSVLGALRGLSGASVGQWVAPCAAEALAGMTVWAEEPATDAGARVWHSGSRTQRASSSPSNRFTCAALRIADQMLVEESTI
jgi:hypothetical protein